MAARAPPPALGWAIAASRGGAPGPRGPARPNGPPSDHHAAARAATPAARSGRRAGTRGPRPAGARSLIARSVPTRPTLVASSATGQVVRVSLPGAEAVERRGAVHGEGQHMDLPPQAVADPVPQARADPHGKQQVERDDAESHPDQAIVARERNENGRQTEVGGTGPPSTART